MKKLPKTLEKLILFIEAQGLDWATGKHSREDTYIYWAEILLPGESLSIRSRGDWPAPVDALTDAYARFTASKHKPITSQLGIPPRQKGVGKAKHTLSPQSVKPH